MTAPELETTAEALMEPAETVGAPYRVLTDPGVPLVLSSTRRARPVMGPALTTYALLLWSYLVFGQFTTTLSASTPLGEGKALFGVFAVTSATWVLAIRRSRLAAPPTGPRLVARAVAVAACAAMLFVVTIFLATAFGSISTHLDMVLFCGLALLALGAAFYGRRLLFPDAPPRNQNERGVLVGVWMTVVLVTVVAGIDLALNG